VCFGEKTKRTTRQKEKQPLHLIELKHHG